MPELPPAWQRVFDQQKEQLDRMMALLADNNRELKQLRKMLRRREDQLKRSEREVRKLRKKKLSPVKWCTKVGEVLQVVVRGGVA